MNTSEPTTIKPGQPKQNRLLPVIYVRNTSNKKQTNGEERSKCIFLLKALRVTQDPKKLANLMGVKKVAEVYRTLDKLALRKEYHQELVRLGIDFNYILSGFKRIIDYGVKDADKVNALKALLKSVGMDEYKETESASEGGWEDVLSEKIDAMKAINDAADEIGGDYVVHAPQMPSSAKMLSPSKDHTAL